MKSLIFSRCRTLRSTALRSSAAATASRTRSGGCRGGWVMGSGFICRGRIFAGIVPPSRGPAPGGGGSAGARAAPAGGSTKRRPAAAAAGGPGPLRASSATSGWRATASRLPARPGQHHQPGRSRDLPPAHPVVEIGEGVAADQQEELGVRHRAPEVLQGLDRVGRPVQGQLVRRGVEPLLAEQRQLHHGVAGEGRRQDPARLVRRLRRRQVDHPVEPERAPRRADRRRCARGGWGRSCRRRGRSSWRLSRRSSRSRAGRAISRGGSPSPVAALISQVGQARAPPPPGAAPRAARGPRRRACCRTISRGRSISSALKAPSSLLDGRQIGRRRSPRGSTRSTRWSSTRQRSTWRRNWMPRPAPCGRAGDQPRQVGDDEGLGERPLGDHAELRHQGGERVVGDLRPRRRDDADQRRLAGVGQADRRRRRRAA